MRHEIETIHPETRELVLTRMLNAPISLVWEAWTNRQHIQEWWGPKGFTNPVCEWNAQVGSKILIHMKAPNGVTYPMDGEFLEIVQPTRLAFISAALDDNSNRLFEIHNTVTFAEENGKTKMTLHAIASNIISEGKHYLDGMNEGWNMSIDRLDTLLEKNAANPLIFERTYNAPVETVWKAISDRDEMKKWYFDIAAFKPEVGCEFSFSAGPNGKSYLHLCKVTEVDPGKKLTYSWRYDGYEGNSFVSFELFPDGNSTKLKLTHTGLETFPANNPDFAKSNFVGGWTYFTGTALKNFLEGTN